MHVVDNIYTRWLHCKDIVLPKAFITFPKLGILKYFNTVSFDAFSPSVTSKKFKLIRQFGLTLHYFAFLSAPRLLSRISQGFTFYAAIHPNCPTVALCFPRCGDFTIFVWTIVGYWLLLVFISICAALLALKFWYHSPGSFPIGFCRFMR